MKKIILLILTIVLSISLAACGDKTSKSSSTNTNVSSASSNNEENVDIEVYAPNGAPAFSQALLATSKSNLLPSNYEITTHGVEGSVLGAQFNAGSAEFIFAPSNLGAKLYNVQKDNAKYVYAANVTFGNLYLATTLEEDDFELSDLESKDLITFGEGAVVDAMLKKVLSDNKITVKSTEYKGSVQDIVPLVLKQHSSYYLLAEPVLSVVKSNLNKAGIELKTISIQDELKKIDSASFASGFAQAGVFVNKEFLKNNKTAVNTYLEALKKSCASCNDTTKVADVAAAVAELAYAGTLPEAILVQAISKCGINYLSAKDAKTCFNATYEGNLAAIGGMLPDEGFFAI